MQSKKKPNKQIKQTKQQTNKQIKCFTEDFCGFFFGMFGFIQPACHAMIVNKHIFYR